MQAGLLGAGPVTRVGGHVVLAVDMFDVARFPLVFLYAVHITYKESLQLIFKGDIIIINHLATHSALSLRMSSSS